MIGGRNNGDQIDDDGNIVIESGGCKREDKGVNVSDNKKYQFNFLSNKIGCVNDMI